MTGFRRRLAAQAAAVAVVAVPLGALGVPSPMPVAGGLAPAAAQARTFDIRSCGEAADASTAGWTVDASTTVLEAGIECPPRFDQPVVTNRGRHTGVYVTERLGPNDTPQGASINARFTAAPGTRLVRARYGRYINQYNDLDWRLTVYTAEGTVIDGCTATTGGGCFAGGDNYTPGLDSGTPGSHYIDVPNIDTQGLRFEVACASAGGVKCSNGASIYHASISMYGAILTLSDPTGPTVTQPTGQLWTGQGYQEGTLALTSASTDATGIQTTRLYADGQLVAEAPRGCVYTHPAPCTDEPGAALAVNTAEGSTRLADGSHALELRVLDAASNETSLGRPTSLLIDNTAPQPPGGLTSAGGPSHSADANSWQLSWDHQVDAGSPIGRSRYSVCSIDQPDLPCVSGEVDGADQTPAFSLPVAGRYRAQVQLVDALGHVGGASQLELELQAPAPPTETQPPSSTATGTTPIPPPPGTTTGQLPPPTTTDPGPGGEPPVPAVKRAAGLRILRATRRAARVSVSGRVVSGVTGRVSVVYEQRLRGRTVRRSTRALIRGGRFTVRLTLRGSRVRVRRGRLIVSVAATTSTRAATVRRTLTAAS